MAVLLVMMRMCWLKDAVISALAFIAIPLLLLLGLSFCSDFYLPACILIYPDEI